MFFFLTITVPFTPISSHPPLEASSRHVRHMLGSQETDPDPRQNEIDPQRWLQPLFRMAYMDAIQWLKDNDYKKEDGTFYEVKTTRKWSSQPTMR